MGQERFSRAERAACLKVIKVFGGEVTEAGWLECKRQIGRHVSKRTLRIWWRDSLTDPSRDPGRAPRRATRGSEVDYSAETQPVFAAIGETGGIVSGNPEPDNRPLNEKLQTIIDSLFSLTPEQLKTLSAEKRLRLLPVLIEAWQKSLARNATVQRLDPLIGQIVEGCERLNLDPERIFARYVEALDQVLEADMKSKAIDPGT